jgi:hypothetical protein
MAWAPSLMLSPFLTFFFLRDGGEFKRFLSHAVPAGAISDSYAEALAYVYSLLHAQGDRALYIWALRTRDNVQHGTKPLAEAIAMFKDLAARFQ